GAVEAEGLEGGGGERRGEAFVADDDDLLVGAGHLGQAELAGGVETPLQDVAVHDDGARQVAVTLALLNGPGVDDEPSSPDHAGQLCRSHALRKGGPRLRQQLVDVPGAL